MNNRNVAEISIYAQDLSTFEIINFEVYNHAAKNLSRNHFQLLCFDGY